MQRKEVAITPANGVTLSWDILLHVCSGDGKMAAVNIAYDFTTN